MHPSATIRKPPFPHLPTPTPGALLGEVKNDEFAPGLLGAMEDLVFPSDFNLYSQKCVPGSPRPMTPEGSSGLCVDPSGESLGHWGVSRPCLQAWTKDELVSVMSLCGTAGTSVVLWVLFSWTRLLGILSSPGVLLRAPSELPPGR